jgi:hypothetical protein
VPQNLYAITRALPIVLRTRAKSKPMMPSLFKYFTLVGAVLLGLLVLLNSVLEPDGPPQRVKATPKVKVVVKHHPQASLVERLRDVEAVQKAAARGEAPASPVTDAAPVAPVTQRAEPVTPLAAQTQGEPDQASALAAPTTATPTEDARAVRLARKKAKAERARKQRLARSRALEQAAWRQQDQLYGYAPRPTYGPFGGWGQAPRW